MSRKTNESFYVPMGKVPEKTKYQKFAEKYMLPKTTEMLLAVGAAAALAIIVILILLITGLRIVKTEEKNDVVYRYFGWLRNESPVAGNFRNTKGEVARVSGGRIYYSDGSSYFGELKGFLKHGKGTLTFADGSVYEGEFEKDLYSGTGKLTHPDGTYYEGGFSDGKFNGYGKHVTLNYSYEGEFKDGERCGTGVMVYANGDSFSGTFDRDMRADGVYTYKNQEQLEGAFDNNLPSPDQRMIYTDSSGKSYKVTYVNGELRNKQAYKKPETTQPDQSSSDAPVG